MTTLRDAIEKEIEKRYGGNHMGRHKVTAHAIVTAIRAHFEGKPERVSELFGPDFKLVRRDPTEAQVEAIRLAMSPEKFVSHMRAIDCWTEGWLAAEPKMPSELDLVGAAALARIS